MPTDAPVQTVCGRTDIADGVEVDGRSHFFVAEVFRELALANQYKMSILITNTVTDKTLTDLTELVCVGWLGTANPALRWNSIVQWSDGSTKKRDVS